MFKNEMAKIAYQLYVDMQIEEILPLDEYKIYIKPSYTTASWRFHHGKHQIVIGEDIFYKMDINSARIDKMKYLHAYLHHELAHSVWTIKDLKSINNILKGEGFSFSVFNLFEDARIEENMRQHIKKYFNWSKYEVLDIPVNALDMLFYIVQTEHNQKSIVKLKKQIDAEAFDEFKVVYEFYKKIIQCATSMGLVDIMREWYRQFPLTQEYAKVYEDQNQLFVEEAKILEDDEAFDELLYGLTNILDFSIGVNSGANAKSTESISSSLLREYPIRSAFDTTKRDMLLAKMKKLFFISEKAIATRIPSKRLNIKRMASGSEKLFKQKSQPKLVKKKITIILDLSGSMHESIKNMRLLIDVINTMAREEIIEATLILSAEYSGAEKYEIMSMPLAENTIERIHPLYAAEGLANTMNKNIDLLSLSDYVWIFTDGMIAEESINKNDFHKYNIRTHAMYIGNVDYKSEMQRYFDYVICEKDVDDLANQIFNLIH